MQMQIITRVDLAVDIGGTLIKVGISSNHSIASLIFDLKNQKIDSLQIIDTKRENLASQELYFKIFSKIDEFLVFVKEKVIKTCQILNITATGGGALKYEQFFNDLKMTSIKTKVTYQVSMNEFSVLLPSLALLMNEQHICSLTKDSIQTKNILIHQNHDKNLQREYLKAPLILANVGSGMSVFKFEEKSGKLELERLGGSAMAGGFFVGAMKIIDRQFSFEQFSKQTKEQQISPESLKLMKSCIQNLSQIISLYSDISNINTILITGGITQSQLIREEFFKKLKQKNLSFTKISGYMGVIGMFINSQNQLGTTI